MKKKKKKKKKKNTVNKSLIDCALTETQSTFKFHQF